MAHARKNGHTAVSLVKAAAVSVAASAALCKGATTATGATFGPKTIFRPTTMSLALERAGVLPGTHLVSEQARTGLIRHRLDGDNTYKSVSVAL